MTSRSGLDHQGGSLALERCTKAMSEVYHTTSIFQPTTQASREQFDARISIIGKRLEGYVRSRVYYLCVNPDDIEDAIQGALIRLWTIYQQKPWVMDFGDGWWLKVAWRAAQQTLRGLIAQRGLKTTKGLRRLEYNATSLETDRIDLDGLELVEVKHFTANTGRCAPRANRQIAASTRNNWLKKR